MADFIFTRADGQIFSLHPGYNKKKVKVKSSYGEQSPEIENGLYSTDGPGTFRKLAEWNSLPPVKYHFSGDKPWPAITGTAASAGSAAASSA